MGISKTLERLASIVTPTFITPVTPATRKIIYKSDGVPFVYKRQPALPNGWRRFSASGKTLVMNTEPEAWEIDSYLEVYKPKWRLIVLYRLGGQSWLCYPRLEMDCVQKDWREGPIVVHLVSDTVEPFDYIRACGPIYNLIYQPNSVEQSPDRERYLTMVAQEIDPFNPNNPASTVEMARAVSIIVGRTREARKTAAERERLAALTTLEGRLKYQLEFLGAEMVSWRESGNDIVVRWRDQGRDYESRVAATMTVTSAGICLSGQDSNYNLASMVSVMREAVRRNRPGAYGLGNEDYDDDN